MWTCLSMPGVFPLRPITSAPATGGPPKESFQHNHRATATPHTPTASWMQDGWLGGTHQTLYLEMNCSKTYIDELFLLEL